jgi:hypothetical protein
MCVPNEVVIKISIINLKTIKTPKYPNKATHPKTQTQKKEPTSKSYAQHGSMGKWVQLSLYTYHTNIQAHLHKAWQTTQAKPKLPNPG